MLKLCDNWSNELFNFTKNFSNVRKLCNELNYIEEAFVLIPGEIDTACAVNLLNDYIKKLKELAGLLAALYSDGRTDVSVGLDQIMCAIVTKENSGLTERQRHLLLLVNIIKSTSDDNGKVASESEAIMSACTLLNADKREYDAIWDAFNFM